MGIEYLTSYVRNVERLIADQLTFPAGAADAATDGDGESASAGASGARAERDDQPEEAAGEAGAPSADAATAGAETGRRALVIDAWAWVFHHYQRYFGDLCRGGEYARWAQHARRFCAACRACGLEPVFVFDGPMPPTKLPTVLARRAAQVRANNLYMRLSARSRASRSAQHAHAPELALALTPPLALGVLASALRDARVECIWSDTEADSLVAEEAERRQGLAVSNDSDAYVLCARGDGSRYVPVASIEFLVRDPAPPPAPAQFDEQAHAVTAQAQEQHEEAPAGDDGFAVVGRKGKAKRSVAHAPPPQPDHEAAPDYYRYDVLADPAVVIPGDGAPASASQDSGRAVPVFYGLRLSAHSPSKLAAHLGIPATFLPLLAAFVGNDHTLPAYAALLDVRVPRGPERIPAIAGVIRAEWAAMASARAARSGAGAGGSGAGGERAAAASAAGAARAGSKTPTRRVGLGRLAGPAFSSLSAANRTRTGAYADSDDGAPSSGTATPTRHFAAASAAAGGGGGGYAASTARGGGSAASASAAGQTPSGRLADPLSAADVSTALALDPVRGLVARVLDAITALRAVYAGGAGAPARLGQAVPPRFSHASSGDAAAGEREALIEGLLDSVAVYSLMSHHAAPHYAQPAAEFFAPPRDSASPRPERTAAAALLPPPAPALASWWDMRPDARALAAYQSAYRAGLVSPPLVDALTQRTHIPRTFIEDPDAPSPHAAHGAAREVRTWVYAVLFSAWGMAWARREVEEPTEEAQDAEHDAAHDTSAENSGPARVKWIGGEGYASEEDPDELISVGTPASFDTSDEGPLSRRMREEEEKDDEEQDARSRGSYDELQAQQDEAAAARIKPPPVVTEWVRQGDRLREDKVVISSLSELLESRRAFLSPTLLELLGQYEAHEAAVEEANRSASASAHNSAPGSPGLQAPPMPPLDGLQTDADPLPEPAPLLRVDTRKDLLLAAFGRQAPAIAQLDLPLQLIAAALRFLVASEAERLGESSKKHNWTVEELQAAIFASLWSVRHVLDSKDREALERKAERLLGAVASARACPSTRHIHLTSSVQAVFESAELLVEALLLKDALPITYAEALEPPLLQAYLLCAQGDAGALSHEKPAPLIPDMPRPTPAEERVFDAVTDGLEDHLGIDLATARAEKKRAKKQARAAGTASPARQTSSSGANPFALLGE